MQVGFCGKCFKGIPIEELQYLAVKSGFEAFSISAEQAIELRNNEKANFKSKEVCWHYQEGLSLYEAARIAIEKDANILVVPAEAAQSHSKQLLSIVEDTDLQIALENGFGGQDVSPYAKTLYPIAGSTAASLLELVDSMNCQSGGTYFYTCFNVGHAILCGENPDRFVRKVKDSLVSVHVNDNHKRNDYHLIPLRGRESMDWPKFLEALHDIGYNKVLYVDANGKVAQQSEKLAESWMRLLYDVGNYIRNEVKKECR